MGFGPHKSKKMFSPYEDFGVIVAAVRVVVVEVVRIVVDIFVARVNISLLFYNKFVQKVYMLLSLSSI